MLVEVGSSLSLHEPHYLNSLFSRRSNSYSLHPSSFSPLILSYFNKKLHNFRSFSYAALHFLNNLPNDVHSAPTYKSFRKNLPTYLFNQTFPIFRLLDLQYTYLI